MNRLVLYIILSLSSLNFMANALTIEVSEYSLEFENIKKIQAAVIENELRLALKELGQLSIDTIQKSLLRTQLFSQVTVTEIEPSKKFKIYLEEKWTTIPILKFAAGGGITQTTIGVFDPNVFGSYKELGFQLEQLASNLSAVAWHKNPRFLNNKTLLDLQFWDTRRVRIKYDQQSIDPVETKAFVHERLKLYMAIEPQLSAESSIKFSYDYQDDKFDHKDLPSNLAQRFSSLPLPPKTTSHILGVGYNYGDLEGSSHFLKGQKTSAEVKYAIVNDDSTKNFSSFDLSWNGGFEPIYSYNFVQRFLTGTTSTSFLQYWSYLGGLDRIRGYRDNRFSGRYYILSNSELRKILLHQPSWILQLSTFIDLVSVGEQIKEVDEITAGSYGFGIRIILPKIYRFTLRLDIANTFIKNDDENISFGVQQFF